MDCIGVNKRIVRKRVLRSRRMSPSLVGQDAWDLVCFTRSEEEHEGGKDWVEAISGA